MKKLFYEIDLKENLVIEKPLMNYCLLILGIGSLCACVLNQVYLGLFMILFYLLIIIFKFKYFRQMTKKSIKLMNVTGSKYSIKDSKRYQFKKVKAYE